MPAPYLRHEWNSIFISQSNLKNKFKVASLFEEIVAPIIQKTPEVKQ